MTLAWTYTIKERLTIRPSVGFYNILNFANFDLPESMMSGLLTGGIGTINGTTYATSAREPGRRRHRRVFAGFTAPNRICSEADLLGEFTGNYQHQLHQGLVFFCLAV